jgi:P27 family predicted phage terminase small subunit
MARRRTTQDPLPVNPSSTRPAPPRHLDKSAKAAWASLCDDLESQGTLVRTDRKLIELYATTYAQWSAMSAQLESEPFTYGTDQRRYINPLVPATERLSDRLKRLLIECGLTPRTRKSAPAADSPIKQFLAGDI